MQKPSRYIGTLSTLGPLVFQVTMSLLGEANTERTAKFTDTKHTVSNTW